MLGSRPCAWKSEGRPVDASRFIHAICRRSAGAMRHERPKEVDRLILRPKALPLEEPHRVAAMWHLFRVADTLDLTLKGVKGEPVDFARTIVSHGVAELPPNRVGAPTVFEDVVKTI
jgi:hypothetical protein